MKISALESIRKVKKDKEKKGPPPTAKKKSQKNCIYIKVLQHKNFFICLVPASSWIPSISFLYLYDDLNKKILDQQQFGTYVHTKLKKHCLPASPQIFIYLNLFRNLGIFFLSNSLLIWELQYFPVLVRNAKLYNSQIFTTLNKWYK